MSLDDVVIPDSGWPLGMELESEPERVKSCGCVFRGWYHEGQDRMFEYSSSCSGWSVVTRCIKHQELYEQQMREREQRDMKQKVEREVEHREYTARARNLAQEMMHAGVENVPMKRALDSYRSTSRSGNSDQWVLNNIIKKCRPLQPCKIGSRWYVNGNALNFIDWKLIRDHRFPTVAKDILDL